jgi:hypothetical protein
MTMDGPWRGARIVASSFSPHAEPQFAALLGIDRGIDIDVLRRRLLLAELEAVDDGLTVYTLDGGAISPRGSGT